MNRTVLFSLAGLLAAGALEAQEVPRYTGNIGVGFTEPVNSAGSFLDTGWNIQAGGGINFLTNLGAMVEFNYNSFGINSATLEGLGAPGGNVNIWSFTLDPIVHLNHTGPVDVYFTGGGGIYHRLDQLTQPAYGFAPIITPFGFFNVPTVGDIVLSSYSVNKPGVNVGAGITFGSIWRARFYAEARYHRMFTDGGDTDFVPVTFGVRW
jgi:Outer membrane protein beta-barrel domain